MDKFTDEHFVEVYAKNSKPITEGKKLAIASLGIAALLTVVPMQEDFAKEQIKEFRMEAVESCLKPISLTDSQVLRYIKLDITGKEYCSTK